MGYNSCLKSWEGLQVDGRLMRSYLILDDQNSASVGLSDPECLGDLFQLKERSISPRVQSMEVGQRFPHEVPILLLDLFPYEEAVAQTREPSPEHKIHGLSLPATREAVANRE